MLEEQVEKCQVSRFTGTRVEYFNYRGSTTGYSIQNMLQIWP